MTVPSAGDDPAIPPAPPAGGKTEENQVGKRYRCQVCGTVIICVKRGGGRFGCHGQPMELQSSKPLPSSD